MANKCNRCKDFHRFEWATRGDCRSDEFKKLVFIFNRIKDDSETFRNIPITDMTIKVHGDFGCNCFKKRDKVGETKYIKGV